MRIVVERLRLNDIIHSQGGLPRRQPLPPHAGYVHQPGLGGDSGNSLQLQDQRKGKVEIENIRISGEGNYTDLNASIGDTVKIGRHRFALAKPKWDASEYTGKSLNYAHLPVKGTSKALAAQVIAALGSRQVLYHQPYHLPPIDRRGRRHPPHPHTGLQRTMDTGQEPDSRIHFALHRRTPRSDRA